MKIINKFKPIVGTNLNKITKIIIISGILSNFAPSLLVTLNFRAINPSNTSKIPQII